MIQVLFVCLGNICRSPMAEAIFAHQVKAAGLPAQIAWDSAGTSNYHPDELPDWRTRKILEQHGIQTRHLARQILRRDFETFDYVLAMDRHNLENLSRLYRQMREPRAQLALMGDYMSDPAVREVPDPYYGDLQDFEAVYQLLEPACARLLQEIRSTHAL